MRNKSVIALMVLFGFSLQAEEIDKQYLFIPSAVGNIKLHHTDQGFKVTRSSSEVDIHPCFMDKTLRNISSDNLKKLLHAGAKISVNRMRCSNDYSLRLSSPLQGGGPIGATVGAVTGKLLVHGAAQTVYFGVSGLVGLFCPPAAPIVYGTLQATFAVPVEAASNAAAIGCGIIGAAATGPV